MLSSAEDSMQSLQYNLYCLKPMLVLVTLHLEAASLHHQHPSIATAAALAGCTFMQHECHRAEAVHSAMDGCSKSVLCPHRSPPPPSPPPSTHMQSLTSSSCSLLHSLAITNAAMAIQQQQHQQQQQQHHQHQQHQRQAAQQSQHHKQAVFAVVGLSPSAAAG